MAHMITMPPTGLVAPQLFLNGTYIFQDYMVLDDDLQIIFTDNGTLWGTPQGYFKNHDLPAFPAGAPVVAGTPYAGTSQLPGVVALTFYDSKTQKTYVCILTIVKH